MLLLCTSTCGFVAHIHIYILIRAGEVRMVMGGRYSSYCCYTHIFIGGFVAYVSLILYEWEKSLLICGGNAFRDKTLAHI